ncbi:alkaline phosphatase [Streptoalloteichus tenebrarius]|uniref:Alkaline phosphatase n=1 Tax=Streptoalloteichus tenebrarius (strain ATCC 17920 / DSM 40477 / JCM 4838 / CBS 697.72 / NBRC 16177 / NCIMB 11028 / NRRL B-12390 / A12253. 1 / ISP 5477) TaxID=1933 RepID=A0ABT1HUY0_STRSD|nr:alkaline phosphatase [Streptoalloteichus tenebrarius]MCP2259331.1 alkaline phosphatase [Streptoalloteichus tenebrarius]BFE99096.1 alkaline phosphatase [Streptoalloteichus tenebrarius]
MGVLSGPRRWVALGVLGATVAVGAPSALAQGDQEQGLAAQGRAEQSSVDRTHDVRRAIQGGRARNVILFIGDGMGDSEITIARNYAKGAAGRLAMDGLPLTGAYTTYSVTKDDPSKPDYVTDSAASGTGWATGKKTYNGAISVDAHGKPSPTILELAKREGFRTGDVTTAEVQDATPAVLGAHVVNRDCKGPDETSKKCAVNAKENGGAGSIAEQLVQTRPDVLLGGGAKYFRQTVKAGPFAGKTVLDQARTADYQVVTDANGLREARGDKPVLGLFADGNMAVQWTGPAAKVGGTSPSTCQPNPKLPASQPKLADMTRKALDLLDRKGKDHKAGKGFFLQVEGASIDKQDHAADPCGQIGETVGFDDAVAVGMAYARSHPDTLVIVTADHAHTSQIIPNDAKSPGQTATLVTHDGAPMTINYATNTPGESQEHTGTQVRIAGYGPQAANVVGVTDQTDLFRTVTRALGVR